MSFRWMEILMFEIKLFVLVIFVFGGGGYFFLLMFNVMLLVS